MALLINKLSLPRGVRYECEICGKVASYRNQFSNCFYCNLEHHDLDWEGIKSDIYKDLGLLKGNDNLKKEILVFCEEKCKSFLVDGNFDLSIPSALQGLKIGIELYGKNSPKLVSSYLYLAEANLGLKKIKVAENFLILATAICNSEDLQNRSSIERNFGRVFAAQGKTEEALDCFCKDVLFIGKKFGSESFKICKSFFHIGKVLTEKTENFFEAIVENYEKFFRKEIERKYEEIFLQENLLMKIFQEFKNLDFLQKPKIEMGKIQEEKMTVVELNESFEILKKIVAFAEKEKKEDLKEKSIFVISLAFIFDGKFEEAEKMLEGKSNIEVLKKICTLYKN